MQIPLEVDDHANGSTLTLAPGQDLIIRLPENPTTGYRWVVESCGAMRLDADDFIVTSTRIGGGGTRQLRWSVRAPGRSEISLTLKRAWQSGNVPLGGFKLHIVSNCA